jgi:hypothetical protein
MITIPESPPIISDETKLNILLSKIIDKSLFRQCGCQREIVNTFIRCNVALMELSNSEKSSKQNCELLSSLYRLELYISDFSAANNSECSKLLYLNDELESEYAICNSQKAIELVYSAYQEFISEALKRSLISPEVAVGLRAQNIRLKYEEQIGLLTKII